MNPLLTSQMAEYNRLCKETDNAYSRYAASHGISPTMLCIMYSIYTEPLPCTQTKLVEDWGMPMQTVNSCLKGMEKKGLVRLEFADGNRKTKRILPTALGKDTAERIVAPLVEAENRALEVLGAQQRKLLMELTKKHLELLQGFLFDER